MGVFEQLATFIERIPGLLLDSGELGIIYAIMALGVFISFRTLNTPDPTVDGSFALGAAFSAVLAVNGHPVFGLIIAFLAGSAAGCITSLINVRMGINPLLASILVMLGLYSVNLRVMGKQPNIPINKPAEPIYSLFKADSLAEYGELVLSIIILSAILISLYLFLKTRFGFVLRATGDNENMVRASGVNTDITKLIGLALANGLTALSGGMIAQFQRFSDVQMGTGMVVIGLSSVIIGEVVFGTRPLFRRLIAVVLGSVLYRFIISIAYEVGLEASDLKLVSAVIVGIALSAPKIGGGLAKLKSRFSTGEKAGEQDA